MKEEANEKLGEARSQLYVTLAVKEERDEKEEEEEENETHGVKQEHMEEADELEVKEDMKKEEEQEEEEQQEYNSKEEEISGKAPRTCNIMFGCGRCFCDQCYPPGDALGRRR